MAFRITCRASLLALLHLFAGIQMLSYPLQAGVENGPSDGSYHFVVLPDTQYYYSDQGSGNFGKWLAQMNWIRDHADSHALRYVLHMGDITDQSDHSPTHLSQWNAAKRIAEGIMEKVPLALTVGNHDGLENSRTSLFSNAEYFGAGSTYSNQPTLLETMEPGRWENSVHRFVAEGRTWLIIAMEWGPRDAVVAWAEDVLTRYPDDYVILIVHAYLFRDSSRFDWDLLGNQDRDERQRGNPIGYSALGGDPKGVNDGQKLWNKLIRRHANVKLVLNGHVARSGHGRRVSVGDNRYYVHQHLVNFQHWTGDGQGRMRLMEINSPDETIAVTSFSPFSGETLHGPDLNFAFSLSSRPLKAHYREALRELDPVAAFRLQGENPGRPLISQFSTWELAKAEGFIDDDGSRFRAGRRIRYQSSSPASGAWTSILWFRSVSEGQTLPVLQVRTESDSVLSVYAEISQSVRLPLDESYARSDFAEDSNRLTLNVEPSQWHHLVLQHGGGKLMVWLDGEVLSRRDFPAAEVSRFVLGDFAGRPIGDEARWRIVDFSFHSQALSFPDLEWLWRSAFCQTLPGEISFLDRLGPIPAVRIHEESYPGFALRSEIGGELLFGTAEASFYRISDSPESSRDPNSRYFRLARTLEYSDGVLLATPRTFDAASPVVAHPPIQWKVSNQIEDSYMGSAYLGTQMSVLNVPLPIPFDGSFERLNATFFPFANDWKGGYVRETGDLFYGQEEVIEEVALKRLGKGEFSLTPPAQWGPMTVLGQTALIDTGLTVQPNGESWELSVHETGQLKRDGEAPFAFVFLPLQADGVRSGWYDPASPAQDSPWKRLGTGSYRFGRPLEYYEEGVLQITPGKPADGAVPRFKLFSVEEGIVELRFEVDGEPVDMAFSWGWIASATKTVSKLVPVDSRIMEALADAAYSDFGWYFTERLAWISIGSGNWPWVWSARSGWIYLFLDATPSDGLWFFRAESSDYLYVDRNHLFWAYSIQDGWIPWNREFLW